MARCREPSVRVLPRHGRHAWRHSDAELAAIVAQDIGASAPGRAGGMPAFAGRLGNSEIEAVLAYVRGG